MNPRSNLGFASGVLLLAGCAYSPTVGEYSVGGTVSGLSGGGILLSDAAGSAVFVSSDGRFRIENAFPDGAAYDIAVASDPSLPTTRCSVTRGSGVIEASDVEDVSIVCNQKAFKVGGVVTGLDPSQVGLVLENRGEAIALSRDGVFGFFSPVATGSSYAVSIVQAPEGSTCSVEEGTGVIEGADVRTVRVVCLKASVETAQNE